MHILQIQDVCFDDEATRVMGGAFDRACSSIGHFARVGKVRELIARRIIGAAKNGERDPAQLHSEATMGFNFDNARVPIVSVARKSVFQSARRSRGQREHRESSCRSAGLDMLPADPLT